MGYAASCSTSFACLYCVYGRSLVQCETTHGVYEFRRGFCTLVLSFRFILAARNAPSKTYRQHVQMLCVKHYDFLTYSTVQSVGHCVLAGTITAIPLHKVDGSSVLYNSAPTKVATVHITTRLQMVNAIPQSKLGWQRRLS